MLPVRLLRATDGERPKGKPPARAGRSSSARQRQGGDGRAGVVGAQRGGNDPRGRAHGRRPCGSGDPVRGAGRPGSTRSAGVSIWSRRCDSTLGSWDGQGQGKRKVGAGDVASNRYASHRYELIERLECGVMLEGTEVKALRTSGAQLKDGYAAIRERRAVAALRAHPALRAGLARKPRPRAPAQAAAAPPARSTASAARVAERG